MQLHSHQLLGYMAALGVGEVPRSAIILVKVQNFFLLGKLCYTWIICMVYSQSVSSYAGADPETLERGGVGRKYGNRVV